MNHHASAVIAALAVLTLVIAATPAACAEASAGQDDFDFAGELKGKIVLLEVNRSNAVENDSFSALISDARITQISGRYFIFGKGYGKHGSQVSTEGMLLGVPWDSVLRIQVMTEKQLDKYMEQWKDYEGEE
ncbi:MAG TPA: hypothetical protein VF175_13620 [Lacipirellula sp.]